MALHFSDEPLVSPDPHCPPGAGPGLQVRRIARANDGAQGGALHDVAGEAWQRYGARPGTLVLVRPDGYVLGRWPRFDAQALHDALEPFGLAPSSKQRGACHGR